jgi:hypothetical protein
VKIATVVIAYMDNSKKTSTRSATGPLSFSPSAWRETDDEYCLKQVLRLAPHYRENVFTHYMNTMPISASFTTAVSSLHHASRHFGSTFMAAARVLKALIK